MYTYKGGMPTLVFRNDILGSTSFRVKLEEAQELLFRAKNFWRFDFQPKSPGRM